MWLLNIQLLVGQNRYGLVWTVVFNPAELPMTYLESWYVVVHTLMLMLPAQVCGCTTAHPGLPHQTSLLKKRNGKLVMRNKVSGIKQVEMQQFW